MSVTYSTCKHCGNAIFQHNNGRWRHCADTSRWCKGRASLFFTGEPFDVDGPVAEPQ